MNIQIIYFLSTFVIVNTGASNLFHGSGCLILRAVLPVWYLVSSPTIHDPRGLATSTTLFFFFWRKSYCQFTDLKQKKNLGIGQRQSTNLRENTRPFLLSVYLPCVVGYRWRTEREGENTLVFFLTSFTFLKENSTINFQSTASKIYFIPNTFYHYPCFIVRGCHLWDSNPYGLDLIITL